MSTLATRIGQEIKSLRNEVSNTTSISAANINKPTITSPIDGAVDYLGDVVSSAYQTSDNYSGVLDNVIWQAALDNEFTNIVDTGTGSTDLTWTPAISLPLTEIFVRVRHESDGHLSNWSDAISFTTPYAYVEAPTLTVGGSPDDVAKAPTLTTSAFSVFNGSDTHMSTDWIVKQGGTIVWSSLEDTTNLLSIVVPDGILEVSTEYVFEARHRGTTYGESVWVSVVATTKDMFMPSYGVDWDSTADTYTRTGLAAGTANSTSYAGAIQTEMKRCVLNTNGTVAYYLHPTDSTLREDGTAATIDGSAGNVMVEIPKFYHKYENVGGVHKYSVSPIAGAGYTLHPAFIRGGVEKDFRYYPAYEGHNLSGKLISGSGRVPTVSQTRDTFRGYAAANGAGWSLIDWNLLYAVQLLFLTEYATFDTQAMLGNGNDTGGDYTMITGGSNGIGNGSSPDTNDGMWMSYRGIENWYASMWKFIDGVNVQGRVYFVNNNPATFADDVFTGDYISTGITSATASGYVSNMNSSDAGFIPSEVEGSSSTKIPDYFWQTTGNRVVRFGGDAGRGLAAGGFCLSAADAASIATSGLGSGVSY